MCVILGNMVESRVRAQQLISLLKQSKVLSKQKCYEDDGDEIMENVTVEKKAKRSVIQNPFPADNFIKYKIKQTPNIIIL